MEAALESDDPGSAGDISSQLQSAFNGFGSGYLRHLIGNDKFFDALNRQVLTGLRHCCACG